MQYLEWGETSLQTPNLLIFSLKNISWLQAPFLSVWVWRECKDLRRADLGFGIIGFLLEIKSIPKYLHEHTVSALCFNIEYQFDPVWQKLV